MGEAEQGESTRLRQTQSLQLIEANTERESKEKENFVYFDEERMKEWNGMEWKEEK